MFEPSFEDALFFSEEYVTDLTEIISDNIGLITEHKRLLKVRYCWWDEKFVLITQDHDIGPEVIIPDVFGNIVNAGMILHEPYKFPSKFPEIYYLPKEFYTSTGRWTSPEFEYLVREATANPSLIEPEWTPRI